MILWPEIQSKLCQWERVVIGFLSSSYLSRIASWNLLILFLRYYMIIFLLRLVMIEPCSYRLKRSVRGKIVF